MNNQQQLQQQRERARKRREAMKGLHATQGVKGSVHVAWDRPMDGGDVKELVHAIKEKHPDAKILIGNGVHNNRAHEYKHDFNAEDRGNVGHLSNVHFDDLRSKQQEKHFDAPMSVNPRGGMRVKVEAMCFGAGGRHHGQTQAPDRAWPGKHYGRAGAQRLALAAGLGGAWGY